MEVNLITQEDYDRLLELLIDLDQKVSQIIDVAPQLFVEWLETSDVCKLLHISSRTVQNYRDRGMIPFSQIGSKILYKRSDVDDFLNDHYIKRSVF